LLLVAARHHPVFGFGCILASSSLAEAPPAAIAAATTKTGRQHLAHIESSMFYFEFNLD